MLQALSARYQVDFLIIDHQSDFLIAQEQFPSNFVRFLHFTSETGIWEKIKHKIGFVFPHSLKLNQYIQRLCSQTDYAFVFSRYIQPVSQIPKNQNIVADIDDDFEEIFKTRISNAKSWSRKLRLWQIFQLNKLVYNQLLARIALPIVVKIEPKITTAFLLPNLPFQLILKGEYLFKPCSAKTLLYVGKLTYSPNSQGLIWFLIEVWPQLIQQIADIKLILISIENPQSLKLLDLIKSDSQIELKINVDNLEEYYEHAGLVIAPVFEGGGSNIKIAEALWQGRPVITTEFGVSGYEEFKNNSFLKVGNNEIFWTNEIVEILFDRERLVKSQRLSFEASRAKYSFKVWRDDLLNMVSKNW
ncbi:MAG: glycosyltransferase family 4 protein [Algoriphagus sp.]|uniref:glycosyltransferase family 4 protein n=1 Tax=Algoriphagus sp. TaxID=1872435 RepID=UPI0027322DD8|nr:glycosyltransferase family 4 protein [Algoriphagus sp.]MDP3200385.1 glycosyltransferase family 4 protein [Algoriphagus sp.]